jgi:hypothetical protein
LRFLKKEIAIGLVLQFVVAGVANQTMSITLLLLIFGLFVMPKMDSLSFSRNITMFLSGWIVLTTATYIGLSAIPWLEFSNPWIFIILFWVMVLTISSEKSVSKPSSGNFATTLFAICGWFAVTATSFSFKINLLGLGYDNYGHIAGARFITEAGRNFLLHPNERVTNVVTDTPQGAASAIAGLNAVLGNLNHPETYINLYVAAIFALPLLMAMTLIQFFRSRNAPVFPSLIVLTICGSVIFFGGSGRIWFSGYFGSNLATVLMCISAIHILTSRGIPILETSIALCAILILWPPLGLIYGMIIALVIVLLRISQAKNAQPRLLHRNTEASQLFQAWRYFLLGVGLLTVWFTFVAVRRSFDIGHYGGQGGIEAPRIIAYSVSFLLLLATVFINRPREDRSKLVIFSILICLTSLSIMAQSNLVDGMVTYYPAKVVNATFHLILITTAIFWAMDTKNIKKTLYTSLIFLAVLLFQGNFLDTRPETFTTGYMGKMSHVFDTVLSDGPTVVNGKSIVAVHKQSGPESTYLLFLSDRFESELSTRWMNTLNLNWSNPQWFTTMEIRELIIGGKVVQADSLIYRSGVRVIVDEKFLNIGFKQIQSLLPMSYTAGLLCELSSDYELKCN